MPWKPSKLTTAQLEERRQAALEYFKDTTDKRTQVAIAALLDVTPAAVSYWRKSFNIMGEAALRSTPRTGRKSRLSTTQLEQLRAFLEQSPVEHGFERLGWTLPMVTLLIDEQFKISYHRDHVGKILHQIGLSAQRPQVRGVKRDDAAVANWVEEVYPALKKSTSSRTIK